MDVIEAAELLDVAINAQPEAIKLAWRRAASAAHPDRGGNTQAMQRLNQAYEYLSTRSIAIRVAEWNALCAQKASPNARPAHQKQAGAGAKASYSWTYANSDPNYRSHARSNPRPSPKERTARRRKSAPALVPLFLVGMGRPVLRLFQALAQGLAVVLGMIWESTLGLALWTGGLLLRVVTLAAAIYGWLHLEILAFTHALWSWPWWIGIVGACAGGILFFRGSLPFVFHGWEFMVHRLGNE